MSLDEINTVLTTKIIHVLLDKKGISEKVSLKTIILSFVCVADEITLTPIFLMFLPEAKAVRIIIVSSIQVSNGWLCLGASYNTVLFTL